MVIIVGMIGSGFICLKITVKEISQNVKVIELYEYLNNISQPIFAKKNIYKKISYLNKSNEYTSNKNNNEPLLFMEPDTM